MNCSRPLPTRLAIQLLLILLLTPIISSTRQCPVAPVNHTALGIALGASNYQGASTTGNYQTNTGIVAFTLDGAQFVGGNTTAPLARFVTDRYYEFIASADHMLTFTATAPSNPFGGTMTGVYDVLSVRVDYGSDWQTAKGTDTQLVVTQTIDLAHPPDGKPEQTITVDYGQPSWPDTESPGPGYPDYYYGHTFSLYIQEIPIITMQSNVTGTITLPQAVGYQDYVADVSLTGHVDPPNTDLTPEVLIDGVVWNYASNFGVYPNSNGDFTIPWSFDSITQYDAYGTSAVLYTFFVNYAYVDDYAIARASASVNLTVVVSSSSVNIPPPSENNATLLPVIFIPGVGGTELDVQSGGETNPLWPIPGGPSRWQTVKHFWQLATKTDMSALNLTSGGTASADPNISVSPGDILRTSPADFYGGMISFLQSIGYVEGQNLFVFPYDWRLDNAAHLNDLDRLVDQAMSVNGSQKVVLLAHSMGGLIATAYVNSDPARAAKVDSIITMGTPFWGSPKCYYALTEGYALDNAFADVQQIKSMAYNWPAIYELLPKSWFISMHADYLSLADSFNITYRGAYTDMLTKLNTQMLAVASAFNGLLGTPGKPVLAAGVKLYTIIGFGTQTLWGYDARTPTGYEYLHNMTVMFNDEEVALVPKLGDGDGTVPLWGAENDAATAKYYVKTSSSSLFGDSASHGALPNNLKVQSIVASILNSTPADRDEYLYTGGRLNQLEKMDFSIHSDANLEILDGNGGMMGWTGYNGTMFEDLPQGTFLDQDGIQYASIQNASTPYFLFVNGTQTGEFTMTVNITVAGETTAFEYQNVTVVNGTVARLSLDPREVGNALSPLSVTTNGNTTLVFAKLISRTGGQTAWSSTILFGVLVAVAITAVLVILAVERRKKRQWTSPPVFPPVPQLHRLGQQPRFSRRSGGNHDLSAGKRSRHVRRFVRAR